jgi:hypothetical protein
MLLLFLHTTETGKCTYPLTEKHPQSRETLIVFFKTKLNEIYHIFSKNLVASI